MIRVFKIAGVCNPVIADDGLPATEVGEWTLEKHARLRRYIDITRAVRKGFIDGAGATYIDLFSGPGRSIIRETGEQIDGSPLVAMKAAISSGTPFTDIFLADSDEENVKAAVHRTKGVGGRVRAECGPAERTADKIITLLNPYGLHFAFLDPYKLDPLPFQVIKQLAQLKRMDMLIHVSIQDLQRNLRRYMETGNDVFERFAPGWREKVDERQSDKAIRTAIFQHWLDLIRSLDMSPSEGVELVSGSKNQPLYWLVLVSRHKRANEFWEKIRNISTQGRLV